MPFFVALCLIFAIIVQTGSPLQSVLLSPVFIYGGLTIAVVTIIGSFFKFVPENIGYDLFSSSILLAWFAYWKPLFVKDSPIFFFFPVYFALIIAFATLFFIGQRNKIDRDSLQRMKSIVDSGAVDPWFIMVCVLITLNFENHFLQFPVMMTLLTMRYVLSGCLKPN
ncbi:hypothetical protein [Methyloglobulus sp.]|uniref:hypothetical protein n=1 Tax=Methyloglobulus sp. TaxID=2518622 RepID=UPI0032B85F77